MTFSDMKTWFLHFLPRIFPPRNSKALLTCQAMRSVCRWTKSQGHVVLRPSVFPPIHHRQSRRRRWYCGKGLKKILTAVWIRVVKTLSPILTSPGRRERILETNQGLVLACWRNWKDQAVLAMRWITDWPTHCTKLKNSRNSLKAAVVSRKPRCVRGVKWCCPPAPAWAGSCPANNRHAYNFNLQSSKR